MEDLFRRTVGPAIQVETSAGGRAVADPVRPEPARERAAQPVHQRARRHARRRTPDDRDRQQLARRRAARSEREVTAGPVCRALRHRHRHRHAPEVHRARLRSVLHDQAARPGHRARPVDDLRLRPAVGRAGPHLFGSSARARPCASTCRGISARRRRRHEDAAGAQSRRVPKRARRCWWSRTSRTVRMLITEMLDELGYTAIEAADGAGGPEGAAIRSRASIS